MKNIFSGRPGEDYFRQLHFRKQGIICFGFRFFVGVNKLNTFRFLNKNTIRPERIMVLCCTILAHRHNAFIEYFIFHTNIFHFQLFIKDSIVMAIKNNAG